MAETLTPDICVIGGGPAGLSVAAAAAAFGVPVVVIEKGRLGGADLYGGSVPSKALIAAAKRVRAAAEAAAFGIVMPAPGIDFGRVRAHVREVVAAVARNDARERIAALGVRVIQAEARFTAKDAVAAGDFAVKARRFVIATGSSFAAPDIEGLSQTPFLTPETVYALDAVPGHLIVLGAGPAGIELAQAFRRLGAAVTVIDGDEPLAREDRECAAVVLAQLAREGVAVRAATPVVRAGGSAGKMRVTLKGEGGEETIEATHLLIASGRRPNIESLDLDKAGIRTWSSGIRIDRGLRTTNRRVFAIGETVGAPPFTHVATYHASLIMRNALFRLPVRPNPFAVPRVVFTDPEFAQVGLGERQLRELRKPFRVVRWPYAENDRAQAERTTAGHVKILTSRSGRVLGAAIVGPQAGEMIGFWSLVIGQKLNIRALAGVVIPYPTLGETGKRAAMSFVAPRLTSSWVRRIMSFLRKLG